MTATLARSVENVKRIGESELRLTFSGDASLAKGRCDKPEHRLEIQESIQRVCGRAFQLSLDQSPSQRTPKRTNEKPAGKSRAQQIREIEQNPLVQACKEIFVAEITKIDLPQK